MRTFLRFASRVFVYAFIVVSVDHVALGSQWYANLAIGLGVAALIQYGWSEALLQP